MDCGVQCNGAFCSGGTPEASSSCSSSSLVCGNGRKGKTGNEIHSFCSKCKEKEAQVKANQTEGLCGDCLHATLLAKFKGAVNSNGMILPTDKLLLAFSGGPASRVALEFIREIQSKVQRDSDASKDNSLRIFQFGVAFVDESAALQLTFHEACQVIEGIKSIVSDKVHQQEDLHIVPIESIWSTDDSDGKQKLSDLLESMQDATGKEDLLGYIRLQVLQKIAVEHGYSKLILGLCTTRIATHVVASTVKGQGYCLPGDVQYVDARWKVPVLLPLRDCVAKELTMLCHVNSWKTIFTKALSTLAGSHFSVNSLVESFVALLQEENPSRERTIARTAEKLKPFGFNRLPETDTVRQLSHRRSDASQHCRSDDNTSLELLCPICSAPLNEKDFMEIRKGFGTNLDLTSLQAALKNRETRLDLPSPVFHCLCCPSCQFQILQEQKPSGQFVYSLLPDIMKKRAIENIISNDSWMRRRIEDCLFSDDDGDEVQDADLEEVTKKMEKFGK
ncbi:hypothetical protein SUGI_0187240 [Cryptomeria japonica]|uniref:cytoplasmic tRNA 2-thiolation protein 2 n=1 Tax=Cryptomeria japonica TaxID=3369 RepID=UPI0024089D05|nr:cytoplasmic tRNA 2-thiolation protein 2 [Cryptomeria japonica]GLJ12244.1 hypothetical protein SUGI_0187240 [Cryptomeria japonica]